MRVLLLSSNTGEGHNSAAKAIMEVLEARGVTCEIRDALACLSPGFSKFICNWHIRLYKYAPRLWDMGYKAFERASGPDETSLVCELLAMGAKRLWETVMEGDYDAVICVHVFSAMMMTEVRKSWEVKIPCFFVATDYSAAPLLDQCEMDGYFIPAEELTDEFARLGIARSLLIPSGIPVRQEFYRRGDKEQARAVLGLSERSVVALLMCGSMGCGPMEKIAKNLAERLPDRGMVVAVCGKNERLYESMSELQGPRLRVLGFTKEIADYMDAADLIVTKPGGLSATEAANKHLPMVFINAVGGCEERNFDLFLSHDFAKGSAAPEEVVSQAAELAGRPDILVRMEENLSKVFAQNSAQVISDHVMLAGREYRKARDLRKAAPCIEADETGHPFLEKGGCYMDHLREETIINLARSFAGESQARTRYTVYAKIARKENMEWIAQIFEETADNEAVHAEEFLEMMQKLGGCGENIDISAGYPFLLGDTAQNLAAAAAGELHEHDEAYPAFAEVARREGYTEAARLWMQIARIEGVHHNAFRSLHEQLVSGTLTEKEAPIAWRCTNCGYTYEGIRACDPCPVCGKSAGWQQGELNQKEILPKN